MRDAPLDGSDEYLDAFMHGFEFVLLAMRGRLLEEKLADAERAKLEAFVADYSRFVRAYRERTEAKTREPLASLFPFRVEGLPAATN